MKTRSFIVRTFIVLLWIVGIFSLLYVNRAERMDGGDENTITVFCWSDLFLDEVVEEFEEKTGIKVNVNTFSTNEELLVKLKATGGKGYDLLIPSDYAIRILRESDLIKKLDKKKIATFDDINPTLRGHDFDPNNDYSVPYCWEIFGLVYDPSYFENRPFSSGWSMIFEPKQIDYTIAMVNDPVEAFIIAAYYKYGAVDQLTKEQVNGVENLLQIQKNWVESYGAMRTDYFVSMKNCPLGVTSSSYALLAQSQFPFVEFEIARPNTFITIENLCIPKETKKDEQVYAFINHILDHETYARSAEEYFFFPPSTKVMPYISQAPRSYYRIYEESIGMENEFYFIKNITDEETMRLFWIRLKAL